MWLSRVIGSRSKSRRSPRTSKQGLLSYGAAPAANGRRRLRLEPLEDRRLLTVYVDFGSSFPGGALELTLGDYTAIHGANLSGYGGDDPNNADANDMTNATTWSFSESEVDWDYNTDGVVNGQDAVGFHDDVMQQVGTRFHITAETITVSSITAATDSDYLAAIGSLMDGNDTYVFACDEFRTDYGATWVELGGHCGFGGVAPGLDSSSAAGPGVNDQDETVMICGEQKVFDSPTADNNLADTIVHEVGHAGGLPHTFDTTGGPDNPIQAFSDVMSYSRDRSQTNLFTRYPLEVDFTNGDGTPDPTDRFTIYYEQATDANSFGQATGIPEYVTGTGANDLIEISYLSPGLATVRVTAYSDAARTVALPVPQSTTPANNWFMSGYAITGSSSETFTYTISTVNGIEINAGQGDDLVVIDARITAPVDVFGGVGHDTLELVDGVFNTVEHTPINANSGTIDLDGMRVTYRELEPVIDLTTAANFVVNATVAGETINIVDGPIVSGTQTTEINCGASGTFELVRYANKANVVVNALGGDDAILLQNDIPAVGMLSLTVNAGDGDDALTVDVDGPGSNLMAVPITYDGGLGKDTLTVSGSPLTTVDEVIYTPGPAVNQGRLAYESVEDERLMTIDFLNLEPVVDLVPAATLTVNGTNADNAINYAAGSAASRGLVSVDAYESIAFANKTTVRINGLAGSDEINLNNPNTPTGLTGIVVNGGDPTGSDGVIVNGTTGADTIVVDQFTADGARVTGAQPVPVTLATTEHLSIVGQGGDDDLTITAPNGGSEFAFVPGATRDAASVTQFGFSAGDSLLPLDYATLGVSGSVTFAGEGSGLDIHGTSSDDRFDVSNTGGIQVFKLDLTPITLPINTSGVKVVRLIGQEGDDVFNVPGDHPISVGINVQGGDPSGSDTLNFTGSGGDITIDLAAQTITESGFAPVSLSGIEVLNVAAADAAITINGTSGPDAFTYTPTGPAAGTVTVAGLNLVTNFTDVVNDFTIDPGDGADSVTVNGTTGSDSIEISRNGANARVQVGALRMVVLPSANTEALVVAGGLGDDSLVVNVDAGITSDVIAIPITCDGGVGKDTLTVTGTPVTAVDQVTYTPGPAVSQTRMLYQDGFGAALMTIDALNIEPTGGSQAVTDLVPATTLVVNATNGDNAINVYTQSGETPTGVVTVDGFASIGFGGKTALVINALAGSDEINLRDLDASIGLTSIAVNGGNPTGSDTIIVNGRVNVADTITYTPATTTSDTGSVAIAGLPTVNFSGAEHLVINGQNGGPRSAGDTLTINTTNLSSGQSEILTPGSTFDSGYVDFRDRPGGVNPTAVPLDFSALGVGASLTFADSGRFDKLIYRGTDQDDVFSVNAAGDVTLNTQIVVHTPAITALTLAGLSGDDVFNIAGNHNLPGIVVEGGDPSASDVVNFTGSGAGAVVVDLAAQTVTETGFAAVTLTGVEVANIDAGGAALTLNGTSGPDTIAYTPTGAAAGTVKVAGFNLVTNFTNVGSTFTIDAGAGADSVTVNGTQNGETITADATTVAVGGLKTVTYASTELLQINALAGNDTIDVTPSATTPIFVDGGDPIGSTPGDTIVLHPSGAFSVEAGPESDEGGLNSAGAQRVSWDHIEAVVVSGGGPALILGTNGDDDITIIARDSSYNPANPGVPNPLLDGVQDFTVSVNQGPDVLFINQPLLYVDALAGDDDIVLHEPAPSNAVAGNDPQWNVDLVIVGGPPAAPTGESGDVFEMETPGTQSIVFTPTGIGTGTIGDVNNSSLVTLTDSFTITEFYTSSPGGVEQVVYQGLGGNDTLAVNGTGGADTITVTPGPTADAGTVQVNGLLGLIYRGLGATATLLVNGTGGADTLVVNGSSANDTFRVAATIGAVTLNADIPILQTAITNLVLNGQGGVDVFNLAGTLPYTNTTLNADAIANLTGATGPVTVTLGDATLSTSTTITGYGGTVTLVGIDTANLDANNQDVTATGTAQNDNIIYTPTGATAGTFYNDVDSGNNLVPNTVFNIANVAGNFKVFNDPSGNADQVTIRGTAARDLIEINQGSRVAQVLANNVTALLPVQVGLSVEILNAQGLGGQDTFQVIPGAGAVEQAIDNLLVNIDGGDTGSNNALVIASSFGSSPAALAADQFVVVNRGLAANSGTVRVFTAAVQGPDVNYVNVQVVSPNVATVAGQPNLLILGADANEPNEYQTNAAFLGAGATLQVTHASIFPNNAEFPGVPGDNDFYRVIAQTTGTLDFQVYFRVFSTSLLPAGGNLNLQVLDSSGTVIASAPGTFGTVGTTANARVRIPAVAGQSYWLRVYGANAEGEPNGEVINGYDVTVINSPNPVPTSLELSRSVPAPVAGNPDTGDLPTNAPADDTGRSQFDNVTKVNNPTIYLRLDDAIFLQDVPGNQIPGGVSPMGAIAIPFNSSTAINTNVAGYRIALYDGGNGSAAVGNLHTLDPNDSTFIGFAQPVPGVPHLYVLKIGSQGADSLADGLHNITARVQIIDPASSTKTGFGDRSQALQIVVDVVPPPAYFGTQASTIDGIDPAQTDTGVESYPATFVDRVTGDTRTGFWGTAEANSIVRVYSDQNNNGVVDAGDLLLGETTAVPVDGTNAFPNGQWNLTTTIDLNDPAHFAHDGLRNLLVTGEDLAGNVSAPNALKIFIDTQGPQVTGVQITSDPGYNLFGLKPDNAAQGPTPLVYSLSINVLDLPARSNADASFLYDAVFAPVAISPGHYKLVGDANGVIPIQTITYVPGVVADGLPATGTIVLTFAQPLPDDRFTLTIDDTVVDVAGNKLDGESNAVEPNGAPQFPSGDGNPGGDFVARFTVDSRPEIGTWSAGSVYVDTNGNSTFDPTNLDYTNRDLTYSFGFSTDEVFAGNFSLSAVSTADGFDKLAAYGKIGNQFRWIVDTDNDGVPNIVVNDPANVNGLPVAGNFDGNAGNGSEVGLFDGANWWLDTNHDFMVDTKIVSKLRGYPIVGNFDGDNSVDLATYQINPTNKFFFDLGANGYGQVDATIDAASQFGYIGVRARPVAADMDRDGTTDVGLWIPDRTGATGDNIGEWSFLLSNFVPPTTGTVTTLDHQFSPTPLGHDVSARFGNQFARPVLGNFDPPVASTKAGPAISGVTLSVSGAKPVVTWTVSANSGIASSVLLVDGKAVSVFKPSGSKTYANYSVALASLNLSAGNHTFAVKATDAAGTPITTECAGTFTIVGPSVKSVGVSVAKGVLSWNATSPNGMSGVVVTVDGKRVSSVSAFAKGNYSAKMGLPGIGTHNYTITATDKNGKKVTYSGNFTVAAPTISNVAVAAAKGLVTWTAAASRGLASVGLTIDGKRVSKLSGPNATGNCYGSAAGLAAGTHKYVISVKDRGGKVTTLSGSFVVSKPSSAAVRAAISSASSDSAKVGWLYDLGGLTSTSSNAKKKTDATDAVFAGY
jgi:hypothetical protein